MNRTLSLGFKPVVGLGPRNKMVYSRAVSATTDSMSFSALARKCMSQADDLARCSEGDGLLLRTCLSPEMKKAHELVGAWMSKAGLEVEVDGIGNILGRSHPGRERRVVIGSHLDTVRDAGKYDGMLGVLMGIALAETDALKDSDLGLTIVGFSDEEGVRFGVPYLGSKALLGELEPALLETKDAGGNTLRYAMQEFGGRADARLDVGNVAAFLELHIEQGPVLEARDLPVGIVTGIVGQSWGEVGFSGLAGHAGTTPMDLRQDALVASAKFIVFVNELANQTDGLVATVGRIEASPGSTNVIPGEVVLSLDARHPIDAELDRALAALSARAKEIGQRHSVQTTFDIRMRARAAPFDESLRKTLGAAVEKTGCAAFELVSGAGHDARMFAPHVPSVMLFLRTPRGLSHHPEETVMVEDVEVGLNVAHEFLSQLA